MKTHLTQKFEVPLSIPSSSVLNHKPFIWCPDQFYVLMHILQVNIYTEWSEAEQFKSSRVMEFITWTLKFIVQL